MVGYSNMDSCSAADLKNRWYEYKHKVLENGRCYAVLTWNHTDDFRGGVKMVRLRGSSKVYYRVWVESPDRIIKKFNMPYYRSQLALMYAMKLTMVDW
jgi:hypothetical protein